MEKTPQSNAPPTTDEYVTALRWVISQLPDPADSTRNLLLQGKRPDAIMRVIADLSIELQKRVAKALGPPTPMFGPAVPIAPAARAHVVDIQTKREHST